MNRTHQVYASTAIATVLSAVACPAMAQTTGEDQASEPVMEEMIVTVERRAQSIQDVAATVQSFSGADLLRDGINSEIRNLNFSVPGLNISNQEGNIEVFIRGVGSANNTELGDPAVASHINGVYIPRPRGFGSQFYDIERVELNKGPQGTLRGRNAVGGTINIITTRPRLGEVEGYLQAQIGSHDQRTFEGAINLPLGDTAAVRVAAFHENHDSYFDNAGPIGTIRAAGEENEWSTRASFLWEPTGRFSFEFIFDYTEEGGTGYPGSPLFQAFAAGNSFDTVDPRAVVYRGPEGRLDNEVYGFTGIVNYDFGPVAVEFLSSFRSVDFFQLSANTDGTAFPGRDVSIDGGINFDNFGAVYFTTVSDAYINDIRFFSPDSARLRWNAGAFRMDESQETGFFSVNDNGIFFSGVEFSSPDIEVRSTAGFFDATYDVTDRFRVKGGVRYTTEFKSRFGIGGNWTLGLGADNGCCFQTRLGTEGFVPALNNRPSFVAPTTNAEIAQFLLDGAFQFGNRDTIVQQLAGIVDGTAPNGTCIDTPDTDPGGTLDCPANGQHGFLVLGAPAQQDGAVDDDYIDWRAGIEFDITDDNLVYFTVSTGTKSSGFNDNVTPEIAPTFDTEELLAYEFGTKNAFEVMGQRLIVNGAVFYYDYDDLVQQSLIQVGGVTGPGSSGFSLLNSNVADARIIGVEFDTSLTLPYGFFFSATGSFLDTEVKSGLLADVRGQDFSLSPSAVNIDLSGNELPLASDFQFVMKLQQTINAFGGEIDWQALANYRSSFFLSIFNEDDIVRPTGSTICGSNDAIACGFETEQDGFWTVNFGAGYTAGNGRWRLEGFVTNILNEDASTKALLGNSLNLRFLNLPRTGGVRLRINL